VTTTSFDYETFTSRNIGFVSLAEQERLRKACVFVAGVGGMGGAAIEVLARAGIGRLIFADIDVFEVSNLNRQLSATMDTVGIRKTEATSARLRSINPECELTILDADWVQALPNILPKVDVVINGCDDTRATLALMRQAEKAKKTVVDAFASPLPNVYVVGPLDVRPERLFGYPSVGKPIDALTSADIDGCKAKEIEWVMVHSSSANHVDLQAAGEMMQGKRSRMSFAPMVIGTGCLMAYEALRVILAKPGGPGPSGVFWNPWTQRCEKSKSLPVAFVRRFFVKRFMRTMMAKI